MRLENWSSSQPWRIFNTRQRNLGLGNGEQIIHVYFRKSISVKQGETGEERDSKEAAAEFQAIAEAGTKTHHFSDAPSVAEAEEEI